MNVKATTSSRLKQLMQERNLKQIDILNLTIPYCKKYGVKMNKSDISQYVSGKVEPNQKKLYVLSKALDVSEAWLMGYDVPINRHKPASYTEYVSADSIAFEITGRSLQYSPLIFDALCDSLRETTYITDSDFLINGNKKFYNLLEFMCDSSVSFDDKAYAFRSIIDMVLYDTKNNELSIFYVSENDFLNSQRIRLEKTFSTLNIVGRNKVIDYATDLSNMSTYTNK